MNNKQALEALERSVRMGTDKTTYYLVDYKDAETIRTALTQAATVRPTYSDIEAVKAMSKIISAFGESDLAKGNGGGIWRTDVEILWNKINELSRTALQSQPEWQPIETAPRDGSWIFGYWPSMSITQYPKVIFADDCSQNDIWYMPDNLEFGCVYPTHWMPLPTPPNREGE